MKNILALSGSLRRDSFNTKLLDQISNASEHTVTIHDLSSLPFMNEDLEQDIPESVKEYRNALKEADLVILATPEYNNTFSSIMKNAIEWGSREYENSPNLWKGKEVALVGATVGRWGAARAQHQLKQLMIVVRAKVRIDPPPLMVAQAQNEDDGLKGRIDKFISGL